MVVGKRRDVCCSSGNIPGFSKTAHRVCRFRKIRDHGILRVAQEYQILAQKRGERFSRHCRC